eukprot:5979362-Amphidinium_carterae.1
MAWLMIVLGPSLLMASKLLRSRGVPKQGSLLSTAVFWATTPRPMNVWFICMPATTSRLHCVSMEISWPTFRVVDSIPTTLVVEDGCSPVSLVRLTP